MCTSVMAGPAATVDHVVLLSRNEDFTRGNWNKYLVYRPLPEYLVPRTPAVADGQWTLGNGLIVATPESACGYSAMPDAVGSTEASGGIGDHFFFEERGINEHNLAISATNSMSTNPAAAASDPFPAIGIAESVIPTLILPQAVDARQAVQLLGTYVERSGASEPNGVLIGDPNECWYLEIGSAHHWIAVRVPDDAYVVVANGLRIHDVDLTSDDVMCSPDLFQFVADHCLLDHPDRASFDFAQAFGVLGVPYNTDRVWLAQHLLTPSLDQPPRLPQYPLFLRPDAPLDVATFTRVLRATYAGTVLEGVATRPIGYELTAESHVISLDASQPPELAGLIWQAISTPLGAPYVPLHAAMTDVPASYARGDNTYSASSAYWAFHGAHALRALIEKASPSPTPQWWIELEQASLDEAPLVARMLADAYRLDPAVAVDLARRASTGGAAQAVSQALRATSDMMTATAAAVAAKHVEAMASSS